MSQVSASNASACGFKQGIDQAGGTARTGRVPAQRAPPELGRTWLAWLVGKGQLNEESGMENCEYAPLVCAAVRLCSCTELQ